MVVISPISIWYNGQSKSATVLSAICINDNLQNAATFYYKLMDATQLMLAEGNLVMTGDAYKNWQTNQQAYEWIAAQLNLTIVGQLTTTTTTTSTTTAAPTTTTTTSTTTTQQ